MVQKLTKDVYYEISQLDQQMQRLMKRIGLSHDHASNMNASGVLLGSAVDPGVRNDLSDIKQSYE